MDFIVHDGTGQITCLINSSLVRNLPPIPVKYEDISKEINPITDGCKIMLSALKKLYSKLPKEEDLVPGTIVSCLYFSKNIFN